MWCDVQMSQSRRCGPGQKMGESWTGALKILDVVLERWVMDEPFSMSGGKGQT